MHTDPNDPERLLLAGLLIVAVAVLLCLSLLSTGCTPRPETQRPIYPTSSLTVDEAQTLGHIVGDWLGRTDLRILPADSVSGHSMAPLFGPGTVYLLEPAERSALRPGDIVVFPGPTHHIMHQVVAISRTDLITRGLANDRDDPAPVPLTGPALYRLVSPIYTAGYQ